MNQMQFTTTLWQPRNTAGWVACIAMALAIFTCLTPAQAGDASTSPKIEFKLKDTQGQIHSAADYRGRPLIVNFWATWCPPCLREMPSLNNALDKLRGDQVAIVAINLHEEAQTVMAFARSYPNNFAMLIDEPGIVSNAWRIRSIPTTFLIGPDGRILQRITGEREWDSAPTLAMIRRVFAQ